MNILFLCTGNSCRSIIAEALFNDIAPEGFTAQSAGSKPTGLIHPQALAALKKAGINTNGLFSKSWEDLAVKPNVVITLCSEAQGEVCPLYFGAVVKSHWGMDDPAKVQGSEAQIAAAFNTTLQVLNKRLQALVEILEQNPEIGNLELEKKLDSVAQI